MPHRFVLISHPDVVIDPARPVPRWPLSARGRARMQAGLAQPWVATLGAVHCSAEQKALDAATILAAHLGLTPQVHEDLGENDRSATGFLPPAEFEATADRFFAEPERSVRGWERALDAQQRMLAAVRRIARDAPPDGSSALVSHGAVGTLLHCALSGRPIDRRWDQPANGGGNWYAFELHPPRVLGPWAPIDAPTPSGP